MGEKSTQKKQFIIDKAREVFVEKGFKHVTMKDIVDACQISRGGLYIYFSSTTELFEAVLEQETTETDDVFSGSISEDATMTEILVLFLKEQKKEILKRHNTLTVAIYEYLFANQTKKKESIVAKQFDMAVKVIEALLIEGVKNEEFYCEDPLAEARNIMLFLEGLKITANTMGLTEEIVTKQLLYVMQRLLVEE